MSILIQNGYNIFTDKEGNPLEDGYIFIGEAELNPITNPQTAYWDAALTIPATNIRVSGGYPVYNGSPARLYVENNYSILVQDRRLQTIYVQLDAQGFVTQPSPLTGFDNTQIVVKSTATITVKAGSTADVNGAIAEVATDTDLQVSSANIDYYIELLPDGTVSITASPGTFDIDQNGRYSLNGRILNWLVRRDTEKVYLSKIIDVYNLKTILFSESLYVKLYYGIWLPKGNSLSISGIGTPTLTTLDSAHIAFIDSTLDSLRTYAWGGTDWAQEGNSLSISGIGTPALTTLDSTHIAFIDSTLDSLRTYVWDGTDWAQEGNSLSISGIGLPALTTLDSAHIAFIDSTLASLRTYKNVRIVGEL
jgi:hypothetical protein